jgi:hypothetical protein
MANILTANPWVLNTPGVITTDTVRVGRLRWVAEGAAAGDNVVVSDSAGHVFWEATAAGVNTIVESNPFVGIEGDCRGLVLTTIQAGKLYVSYA